MKKHVLILVITAITGVSSAQTISKNIDSYKKILMSNPHDTDRVEALYRIGWAYRYSMPDSALLFANEALKLARKINDKTGEGYSLNVLGNTYCKLGNYPQAVQFHLEGIKLFESLNDKAGIAKHQNYLAEVYMNQNDFPEAINYMYQVIEASRSLNNLPEVAKGMSNLGELYLRYDKPDSALKYVNRAYELSMELKQGDVITMNLSSLGEIHSKLNNKQLALEYYRLSIPKCIEEERYDFLNQTYYGMAALYKKSGEEDSAIFYGRKALEVARKISHPKDILSACTILCELLENKNPKEAFNCLKESTAVKDSLFEQEKTRQIQIMTINENLRQSKIEEELMQARTQRKKNIQIIFIAVSILSFAIFLLTFKKKINSKVLVFLGLLNLLLFYEFINMLIHPVVENITGNVPVLMLGSMVIIGALLVPLHHKMESLVVKKLAAKI